MSDKFWEFLIDWSVPLYLLLLSVWAGTAHTIRRIRRREIPYFSIREWVGDIVISSFIGAITFHLCKYAGLDDMLMACCVGVASHMGTRALSLFEKVLMDKASKTTGVKLEEDLKFKEKINDARTTPRSV